MEDLVEARLTSIALRYWQIPLSECDAFRKAVLNSSWSRAQALRQQLALMDARYPTVQGPRESDAQHTFDTVITPRFIMALLHDLVLEVRLTPRQCRTIQEAILRAVDRSGKWKAV